MNLQQLKQEAREAVNEHVKTRDGKFIPCLYTEDRELLDTLIDKVVHEQHLHVVREIGDALQSGKELDADTVIEAFRSFRGV